MSKIIQGNFGGKLPDKASETPVADGQRKLSPDQEKAIGLVMSGVSFVFIGIKPAPTGADFYTALHGDATDLRNAQDHLPDVIARLYTKKGIS